MAADCQRIDGSGHQTFPGGANAGPELRADLEHGMPGHPLFTGFTPYRRQLVEDFRAESAAAQDPPVIEPSFARLWRVSRRLTEDD